MVRPIKFVPRVFFLKSLLFISCIAAHTSNAGEFLVVLKPWIKVQGLKNHLPGKIIRTIPNLNAVVVKAASIKNLRENSLIEKVEPNFIYELDQLPTDSKFTEQWALKNTPTGIDIRAETAWDLSIGSKKIVVAIIDTGIDYHHPDLRDNIWINEVEAKGTAGVDDDQNGYVDDINGYNFLEQKMDPMDGHGHGTHCAGTIGAAANNVIGTVGVAWQVQMMALKAYSDGGGSRLSDAIEAIDYAVKMKVDIINASWGGRDDSSLLKEAIARARDAGILFVAAAGNKSRDTDRWGHYPASYDLSNIISVASIDSHGRFSRFSNYGMKTVHLAAPGEGILSTYPNTFYHAWSGTSMAAPFVTGVAVLMKSLNSKLTPEEMKAIMIQTAQPLPSLKNNVASEGMLNAEGAVKSSSHY